MLELVAVIEPHIKINEKNEINLPNLVEEFAAEGKMLPEKPP